jgi:hypothetical protein
VLGFSLTKILVLTAIVAVVWYGIKFAGRLEKRRKKESAESRKPELVNINDVGEMIKCLKCDAYVAEKGAMNCGCSKCPYLSR